MDDVDVAPAHWHEAYKAYMEYGEWAAIMHPSNMTFHGHEYYQICIVKADKARQYPVGDHSDWGPVNGRDWRWTAYTVRGEDRARAWFEVIADCIRRGELPNLDRDKVVSSWPEGVEHG